MIKFEIDGEPVPWKRPGILKTKNFNVVYDRQKREKEKVRWQIRGEYKEDPLRGPLRVDIIFRMPIPKSTSKPIRREMLYGLYHHFKKPDIDNLTKFILDCMNELVYADDAQICEYHAAKVYSTHPGTYVKVRPFSRNVKEETDGSDLRDIGSGDLLGDSFETEGPQDVRGKEDRIIDFRDGRSGS